jgi:hypothetical protein
MIVDIGHMKPRIYEISIVNLAVFVAAIAIALSGKDNVGFASVFVIAAVFIIKKTAWFQIKYLLCQRNILTKEIRELMFIKMLNNYAADPGTENQIKELSKAVSILDKTISDLKK